MKPDKTSHDFIKFQLQVKALWENAFDNKNISLNQRFSEIGGHSEVADLLYQQVSAFMGKSFKLSPTIAYDYPSITDMSLYLWDLKQHKKPASSLEKMQYHDEPIAIVGVSCRFPGHANNINDFWRLLEGAENVITEVPKSRFNIDQFYDANREKEGKTVSRWGGFIDEVDLFDAAFFGISPKETHNLDPQQRLLLELSWQALESAGIVPSSLKNSITSVFIGAMFHDYQDLLLKNFPEGQQNAYYSIGNAFSAISGRISYFLGLQGPCMAIDSACSSSLVAVHEACLSLKSGDCNLGIAGGVNIILSPETTIAYSQAGMLSRDGCCKTFSEDANGYVRSEGAGVLILKRLGDAVRDNNTIWAVIKGSAVNQDGSSSGMTAPNAVAQEQLLKQALLNASVEPQKIDYLETHGTGTKIGDPIELTAISAVYADSSDREHPLWIGSVKTNIGHCEAAAGIAGIIKVILSLQHELIPKHLHFSELNPRINLEKIPAQIPLKAIPWIKQQNKLRLAGISSFGFTGTNAHVILEEAPEIKPQIIKSKEPGNYLFMLSAKTESALQIYIESYIDFLKHNEESELPASIGDICYNVQTGREFFEKVILLNVNGTEQLLGLLENRDFLIQDKENLTEEAPTLVAGAYKKIALPTYPFERQRYWMPSLEKVISTSLPENSYYQAIWRAAPLPISDDFVKQERLLIITIKENHKKINTHFNSQSTDVITYDELQNYNSIDGYQGIVFYLPGYTMQMQVFNLIQRLKKASSILTQGLVCITYKAQVLPEDKDNTCLDGVITGLIKTLLWEAPELKARQIDIDSLDDFSIVQAELTSEAPLVAYRKGIRYEQFIERASLQVVNQTLVLNDAASYWITGGLGELGLAVANWLVEQGAQQLILSSRRGLTEGSLAAVEALRSQGVEVIVLALDVNDSNALDNLLGNWNKQYLPLKGLFHFAGVNYQRALEDWTLEEINEVLDAKKAAWSLHTLTQTMDLDYFVLFSSVASFFGSNRQAAYVMGNSILDAIGTLRHNQGLPVTLINWGMIQGGMGIKAGTIEGLISLQEMIEILDQCLRTQQTGIAVIPPDYLRFMFEFYPKPYPAWLCSVLPLISFPDDLPRSGTGNCLMSLTPQARQQALMAMVRDSIQAVLGIEHISDEQGFFEMGMDSLMAVELKNHLQLKLGFSLSSAIALEYNTTAKLVAKIFEQMQSVTIQVVTGNITSKKEPSDSLLSTNQLRLWFIYKLAPTALHYNIYYRYRVHGKLDTTYLQRGIDALVRRHDVLRCRIEDNEEIPFVNYLSADQEFLNLKIFDLRKESVTEECITSLFNTKINLPFKFEEEPLSRFYLIVLGEDEFELGIVQHHIIGDYISSLNIWKELVQFYNAFCTNRKPTVALLSAGYLDYVNYTRSYLKSKQFDSDISYWKENLSDIERLKLPYDYPLQLAEGYLEAHTRIALPDALGKKLIALSKTLNSTLHNVLLSSYCILLMRYCRQSDLTLGTATGGRYTLEFEPLLGFFVNTLALRFNLENSNTFSDVLTLVTDVVIAGMEHEQAPFNEVVDALSVDHSLYHNPLFDVSIIFYGAGFSEISFEKLNLELLKIGTGANLPITFEFNLEGDNLSGNIKYDKRLFKPTTIERLAQSYVSLLMQIIDDRSKNINDYTIISNEEQQKIITAFNDTACPYPKDKTIPQLFESQVEKTPQSIAVLFEDKKLTYQELNEKANQLAHFLVEQGVKAETLVGICLDRSLEMVIAILAILKAGGAYVPIDPCYPQARIDYIVQDAKLGLILSSQSLSLLNYANQSVKVIALDNWDFNLFKHDNLQQTTESKNAVYVIYTSGTTGFPKGVINEQAALVNRIHWMQEQYHLDQSDAVLQKTPYTFDVSVWEFLWPILYGARLVVAQANKHKEPAYITETIFHYKITTLHFVPSMLETYVQVEGISALSFLKRVMVSGEALPIELVKKLYEKVNLFNLYGPTEAAIDVSAWDAKEYQYGMQITPIGKPISNIQLYILGKNQDLLPLSVVGELMIAGDGLARGYLNRSDLTAEKFISNPFGPPGAKMYRTGDLARWLEDGNIEYLGRIDNQVKIRGFRIECGEIESKLLEVEGVLQAIVVVKEDAPGDKRLIAYVVGNNLLQEIALAHLKQNLPNYMIPAAIVFLDKLPLSHNGKIDRNMLPAPEYQRKIYVAPRNEREKKLCTIWEDILGVDRVGIEDDFFGLGGNSLLTIKLYHHTKNLLGDEFKIIDIFNNPTIKKLVDYTSKCNPLVQREQIVDRVKKMKKSKPVKRRNDSYDPDEK